MLVLARKVGERIFIGDNIIIEVIEAQWGTARIAFTAPPEVKIFREELLIRKREAEEKK